MKILLINHYAGSPLHGMEFRPYYLAKEWTRLGHEVRIIASSNSHLRTVQPQLKEASYRDESVDGVQYTWLRCPPYKGNNSARVKNMATFVARLYSESKRLAQSFKPDVVIASSTYPMDIWPAHRIAKLAGAKLVFEVHDLWPLSPMELGGMSKWHPFIMMVQMAENYAYRHSDIVVSILPKVADYMQSKGLPPHKLHLVPNGIDPAEWENTTELSDELISFLASIKRQGNAIVGYAGAHGVANALDHLLAAADLMREDKVAFVLVGTGTEKAFLKDFAQAKNLKNVYFLDPLLKEQIPELLNWFDVAYIGLQRQPLFRFGIAPNKLMDYMMAAKPILQAIEAGNDPVAEAKCGQTVAPEDPHKLVDGIRKLLNANEAERDMMGQNGRKFVMEHHTYPVLANRFLDSFS